MNRSLNGFMRNSTAAGTLAALIFGGVLMGCNKGGDANTANANTAAANAEPKQAPEDAVVEGLVKKTTEQFTQGVNDADFSNIYNNASKDFQGTYTADQMKQAFASYIDKKSVVVPILQKTQDTKAEFTKPPFIRTEKGLDILVANGKFDTKPYNVRFEYEYVNRDGEWKLLKLVINIP